MRTRVEWVPLEGATPSYRQVEVFTERQGVRVQLQSVPERNVLDEGVQRVTHQFAWDELFNDSSISTHFRAEPPVVVQRVRRILESICSHWADARRQALASR